MTDFKRLFYTCCFVFFPALILYSWLIWLTKKPYFDTEIITITVLFATLLAIIIYTWKTWQLKDLTSKQISYSIRPIVVCELQDRLYFRNVGKGVARNIFVDDVFIDTIPMDANSKYKVRVSFQKLPFLHFDDRKQEVFFSFYTLQDKKLEEDMSRAIYNLIYGKGIDFKINIHYSDIENTIYATCIELKSRIISIVSV